jgi:hypothetical protein
MPRENPEKPPLREFFLLYTIRKYALKPIFSPL